jgi:hypothetical protein
MTSGSSVTTGAKSHEKAETAVLFCMPNRTSCILLAAAKPRLRLHTHGHDLMSLSRVSGTQRSWPVRLGCHLVSGAAQLQKRCVPASERLPLLPVHPPVSSK